MDDIRLKQAGLNQYHDVFELPRNCLLSHSPDHVTVAVPYDEITDSGYVHEDRARGDVQEAHREGRAEAIESMQEAIDFALTDLIRMAEEGRLDDHPAISPTDLLIHGDAVAVARAAMGIVLDTVADTIKH